ARWSGADHRRDTHRLESDPGDDPPDYPSVARGESVRSHRASATSKRAYHRNPRRAASRKPARSHDRRHEHDDDTDERQRISWPNAVEKRAEQPRQTECSRKPKRPTHRGERDSLPDDKA